VTIQGRDKPKKKKEKYRWDVRYDDQDHRRRHRQYRGDIELTDKPMWRTPRDYTKVSLKNPKKPVILKPRKRLQHRRPKYRYDVEYEKRASCCRRKEACCIRGVKTKRLPAKGFLVSGHVRIMDNKRQRSNVDTVVAFDHVDHFDHIDHQDHIHTPQFDHYDVVGSVQPQYRVMDAPVVAFDHVDHFDHIDHRDHIHSPQFDHYDVVAEPQYRSDVEYASPVRSRRNVVEAGVKRSRSSFSAQEFEYLKRIHERQRLLNKLLQTHPAEYIDEHALANFVFENEPAAAAATPEAAVIWHNYENYYPRTVRSSMVSMGNRDGLSPREFRELQQWLANLPRVPELSVVEVASSAPKKMISPKIVPGLLDLEHTENTQQAVMERLTQLPEPAILLQEAEAAAVAEDSVDEDEQEDEQEDEEEQEDQAEADDQAEEQDEEDVEAEQVDL